MKTILSIMLALFLGSMSLISQNNSVSMDIQGLIPGKSYTDEQIREALGSPSRFHTAETGKHFEYQYGTLCDYDSFRYETGRGLVYFRICTPNFSLFNGLIKVGDNIRKFSELTGGLLESRGSGTYYFYPTGDTSRNYLVIGTFADGVIRGVSFSEDKE